MFGCSLREPKSTKSKYYCLYVWYNSYREFYIKVKIRPENTPKMTRNRGSVKLSKYK